MDRGVEIYFLPVGETHGFPANEVGAHREIRLRELQRVFEVLRHCQNEKRARLCREVGPSREDARLSGIGNQRENEAEQCVKIETCAEAKRGVAWGISEGNRIRRGEPLMDFANGRNLGGAAPADRLRGWAEVSANRRRDIGGEITQRTRRNHGGWRDVFGDRMSQS